MELKKKLKIFWSSPKLCKKLPRFTAPLCLPKHCSPRRLDWSTPCERGRAEHYADTELGLNATTFAGNWKWVKAFFGGEGDQRALSGDLNLDLYKSKGPISWMQSPLCSDTKLFVLVFQKALLQLVQQLFMKLYYLFWQCHRLVRSEMPW